MTLFITRSSACLLLELALLSLPMTCLPSSAPGKERGLGPLVGAWHLVRYVDTPEGGAPVEAFGTHPAGSFIFTPDGHAAISIMRNPPDIDAATVDRDPDACIPSWYCSYFGTYTVSYERNTWVTHVLGGNIAAYLGTDQARTFKIDGDTLTISESYVADGKRFRAERVLQRDPTSR